MKRSTEPGTRRRAWPGRREILRRVPAAQRPLRSGLVYLRRARQGVVHGVESVPFRLWLAEASERTKRNTVAGLSPEAALHARRNFRLGVANGIIYGLADSLIAPSFVLALFVNRLGAPNILVGLIHAILTGGGFLPQLLVASRVQAQPRVIHWYRRISVIRVAALLLLTLATLTLSASPGLLIGVFFLFYSIYAFAGGVSGIPWLEIISKVISPRRRGSFFSLRSFWGGVLALLASGLVAAVLSERVSGLSFPFNYALIFGVETALVAVALTLMSMVKEPAATEPGIPVTFKDVLRRGAEVFRVDRDYRAFMVARVLLALATIADPFYVVYAKAHLGAPAATVGLYLGASSASSLLSNFVWGPLGDKAGNRLLMTLTVLSVALVPLAALLVPALEGVTDRDTVVGAFALVFVLGGLAAGSGRILANNMVLAIAPPAERATYIGFLNTTLGAVTFIPLVGGAIVDAWGFVPLFGLALVIAGSALLASTRMSNRTATY